MTESKEVYEQFETDNKEEEAKKKNCLLLGMLIKWKLIRMIGALIKKEY